MSFARQLRRHAIELGAVLLLVVCAGAVGAYVLAHQRVRFPWQHVYTIKAEFTSAAAVAPGQGQTVDVAGVKVGEIGKVTLHDGHARIELQIRRDKLPAVYSDARALLRPKTGLQDMSVDLDPGTSSAHKLGDGDVLPVARTLPDVHMDEILSALDADTRAWLQTMLQAGGRGLDGRAGDLRVLFKAGAPTLRSSRRLTDAINGRRRELSRLVHNLRLLQRSGAAQDDDIRSIVSDGAATFSALARHDSELRASLDRLPGTLEAARAALAAARPFARTATPTLRSLEPAVRDLAAVLPKVDPLLRDARPAAYRIRGLVHRAVPVAGDLRPALNNLDAVTPHLSNAFSVLNYVVNELGYNPAGPEEGYLFWSAWFFHNADSILSIEDAQGAAWRGGLITSCSTLTALPQTNPEMAMLMPQLPVCPKDASR
jgi:phospholipid/cholesterol/gamma-HCH transport system substrate-binding protein